MKAGDLVRVNSFSWSLKDEVGLIVGREKFYIDTNNPWRYTVLIGKSGESIRLHENALEKLK